MNYDTLFLVGNLLGFGGILVFLFGMIQSDMITSIIGVLLGVFGILHIMTAWISRLEMEITKLKEETE